MGLNRTTALVATAATATLVQTALASISTAATKEECALENVTIAGILFVSGASIGLAAGLIGFVSTVLQTYNGCKKQHRDLETERQSNLTNNPLYERAKDVTGVERALAYKADTNPAPNGLLFDPDGEGSY